MLKKRSLNERLKGITPNPLQPMRILAEIRLNPKRHYISEGAKKHLTWLYLLYHEHDGNISGAARKIGISRQWLSYLKNVFERHKRDPRSLEPRSRAPLNRKKRKRIPEKHERLIIKERDASPGWGKEKIKRIMKREHDIEVSSSTVNRYLHKHKKIDPKISEKNRRAWEQKMIRQRDPALQPVLRVKHRPPKEIKDSYIQPVSATRSAFIASAGVLKLRHFLGRLLIHRSILRTFLLETIAKSVFLGKNLRTSPIVFSTVPFSQLW